MCNSYSVSVPHTPFLHPVLPQWLVKGLGQSSKSAGGMLHLFTHTPFTQRSRSGLTMPLSRHSVGTYPETSSKPTCHGTFGHRTSQLDKLLWPDPGIPSGISVRELISIHTHTHKKKPRKRGMNGRTGQSRVNRSEVTIGIRLKIAKKCWLYLDIFSCVKISVFRFQTRNAVRCDNQYKTGADRGNTLGQSMLFECMAICCETSA